MSNIADTAPHGPFVIARRETNTFATGSVVDVLTGKTFEYVSAHSAPFAEDTAHLLSTQRKQVMPDLGCSSTHDGKLERSSFDKASTLSLLGRQFMQYTCVC